MAKVSRLSLPGLVETSRKHLPQLGPMQLLQGDMTHAGWPNAPDLDPAAVTSDRAAHPTDHHLNSPRKG